MSDIVERLNNELGWGIGPALLCQEAASTITALREEVGRLTRTVNQYAYERDKAREERDQAERRSEQFWRGQLTALRQRVVEVGGAIVARVHERQTLLPTSAPVRALATLVNEMETTNGK